MISCAPCHSARVIRLICFLSLLGVGTPHVLKGQERCPKFLVENSRSGMHYSIRTPPPYRFKEFPREGLAVFIGAYANTQPWGTTLKGDVHLLEYGWSLGWEASYIYRYEDQTTGNPVPWRADVFAATFSKYTLIGKRGLVAIGPQYGFLLNEKTGARQFFGAQATLSARLRSDLWLSAKVQYKSLNKPFQLKLGIATLLW